MMAIGHRDNVIWYLWFILFRVIKRIMSIIAGHAQSISELKDIIIFVISKNWVSIMSKCHWNLQQKIERMLSCKRRSFGRLYFSYINVIIYTSIIHQNFWKWIPTICSLFIFKKNAQFETPFKKSRGNSK